MNTLLKRFFPILDWLPTYKSSYLQGDVSAGLTVGVLLIPQGMAYAMIAGLPPVYGLYASIVPQFIYAILGTSRQLSVAPVAMDSLLVATGVSVLAVEGTDAYISFAILLAFFMGAFQLLLGVFRMGFITNLLSRPVISGFTTAAAFIIGLNQLKHLLGINLVSSSQAYNIFKGLFAEIGETHLLTLTMAIGGMLVIIFSKKIHQNFPGALVAVALGTILVYFFQFDGVSIARTIPKGFPDFSIPSITVESFRQLAPLAMTIAVIAYMEAFSVAKAIETQRRTYTIRPSQELVALGTANMIGSFFQSFPVTGGFSRSAVNDQAGANTPLASVISATVIALTLLFLTPLFYYLPHAILAAIIMVAVSRLVDFKLVKKLWKESKIEFGLLLATFLITLNIGMVEGIISGIVLSVLRLLFKSAYPHIAQLGKVKGHHEFRNIRRFDDLQQWPHLVLLRLDAPLTFINIQYFKDYVLSHTPSDTRTVILDAGPVSHVDSTAIEGLKDLIKTLEEKNMHFLICDVIGPVRDVFHRTGFMELLTEEHMFLNLNEAVNYVTTHKGGKFKSYATQHSEE